MTALLILYLKGFISEPGTIVGENSYGTFYALTALSFADCGRIVFVWPVIMRMDARPTDQLIKDGRSRSLHFIVAGE